MISNLRSAGASIWSDRRLCLKALPVSCQFATEQPLSVAHSSLPLTNRLCTRQFDHYLHASNGNGNLGSTDIKVRKPTGSAGLSRLIGPAQAASKDPSAAMEWPCPRCTFVNKGELLECELCAQPFISEASVLSGDTALTGFDEGDQIQGGDLSLGWSCSVCTFLNYGKQPACQMCGERRVGDESDPATELRLGSSFRPLRETERPSMPGGIEEATVPNLDDQPSKVVMGGGDPSHKLQVGASQRRSPEGQAVIEEARASDTLPMETDEQKQANNSHKRKIETSPPEHDGISNSLLKMLHDERMKRSAKASSIGTKDDVKATESLESTKQKRAKNSVAEDAAVQDSSRLVIMFYNVWFREDVEMHKRMAAIGKLIEDHQPHVICFQEVTLNIYNLFQASTWWKQYNCSVSPHLASKRAYFTMQLCKLSVAFQRIPFSNSVMSRELCLANLDVGGKKVVIATSHLESPCPAPPTWDQMFSKERVQQAVEALTSLKAHSNTIFGGDMNWNDKLDGAPPLPGGWSDAWLELRPSEPGFTYDSKANPMLGGGRSMRSRLDRVFCHLKDFTLESIEMIGLQEIPGVTYEKEKKVKKQVQVLTLPVLPSDHFGLVLKIKQKDGKD